jgi:hypothetical protein
MGVMRRRLSWSLTIPLALIGSLAGHQLGYRLAVPDPHERAHALERSGHGYLDFAPAFVSVAIAVLLLAFVAAVVRRLRGNAPTGRLPLLGAGLLPPLAFLLQEHAERYLHQGSVPWDTIVQAPVMAGLLLQVPAALLAVALAGWLTRLADRVAARLEQAPPQAAPAEKLQHPGGGVDLPRRPVLALGYAGRGPPASS